MRPVLFVSFLHNKTSVNSIGRKKSFTESDRVGRRLEPFFFFEKCARPFPSLSLGILSPSVNKEEREMAQRPQQ